MEVLERRYPVVVRRFGVREGSCGVGRWRGGEGVVRELEFTEGLQVSILSEVSGRFVFGGFDVAGLCSRRAMERLDRQSWNYVVCFQCSFTASLCRRLLVDA